MPKYAPETIPELGARLPSGAYVGLVEDLADAERSSGGFYQIICTLRVEEPKSQGGVPHTEYYVIGSKDDPDANDPQTWVKRVNEAGEEKQNVAAGRYVEMLKMAGLSPTGDTEQDFQQAKGQRVGWLIDQSVEPPTINWGPNKGQPNPYAGRVRSQISRFFRPGEREPGVYAEVQVAPVAHTAPKPAPKPAPKAAPPPPPAAPSTPRVPPPPPRPAAPPAAAPAPKPSVAPPAAKKVPESASLKCSICGNQVPKVDTKVESGWTDETAWMYESRDDGVYQLGISSHVAACAARTAGEE